MYQLTRFIKGSDLIRIIKYKNNYENFSIIIRCNPNKLIIPDENIIKENINTHIQGVLLTFTSISFLLT